MKPKKKKTWCVSFSKKSRVGLIHAGFLDARDLKVKKSVCLSRLINDLVEKEITEKSKTALITYYQKRINEENDKAKKHEEKAKEYAEIISKVKKEFEKENDLKKTNKSQ